MSPRCDFVHKPLIVNCNGELAKIKYQIFIFWLSSNKIENICHSHIIFKKDLEC